VTAAVTTQTVDVGNSSIGVVSWCDGKPGALNVVAEPRQAAALLVSARVRVLSVAPARLKALLQACESASGRLEVLAGVPVPLLDERLADTAGADRLALALAARPGPAVVVDGGTALTVEVVDGAGVYRGGFIAPGPGAALSGLSSAAPRLPDLSGEPVPIVVGRETHGALSAGGWGLVVGGTDRLVTAALDDLGVHDARVIATGGWGAAWAQDTALDLGEQLETDALMVHRGILAWPGADTNR